MSIVTSLIHRSQKVTLSALKLSPILLAASALVTAFIYRPAHHAKPDADATFENCVDALVRETLPHASGGILRAHDRIPEMQQYGDMLHYRERGISSVTSISVSRIGDETFSMVRTREASVVLPSSLFQDFTGSAEKQYLSYSRVGGPETFISTANRQTAEDQKLVDQHRKLAEGLQACGRWSR